MFDSSTVVMLIVVTFISSLVHLYSISYTYEDLHNPQFMCYLSILIFVMPMLVTRNNFSIIFRMGGSRSCSIFVNSFLVYTTSGR